MSGDYWRGLATLPAGVVAYVVWVLVTHWLDGRLAILRPVFNLKDQYRERTFTVMPPLKGRHCFVVRLPFLHQVGLITGINLRKRRAGRRRMW